MKALIIATSGFRVIMFITGLMSSYYGIKHIRKNNDLIGFILLPILSSIDSATYLYYAIIKFNKPAFITFSNYTQIFYLGLELIVITAFFLKINITNRIILRRYICILSILSSIIILLDILKYEIDIYIIISELLIVNIFSVKYFLSYYDRIKSEIVLYHYIVSGLFIFINITAPYYIIQNNLESNTPYILSYINFINDLGYTILFVSIIKEIKWRATT